MQQEESPLLVPAGLVRRYSPELEQSNDEEKGRSSPEPVSVTKENKLPEAPFYEHASLVLLFAIFGAGAMLPWFSLVAAYDYFHYLWPNFHWEFAMGLAYYYPNILTVTLSLWLAPK